MILILSPLLQLLIKNLLFLLRLQMINLHRCVLCIQFAPFSYFDKSRYFSSSNSHKDSPSYKKNMLNYIEELLNLSIIFSIKVITLQNEAIDIFKDFKSSIGSSPNDKNLNYDVVHTTLNSQASICWQFDSGCFRHMTRDNLISISQICNNNYSIKFTKKSFIMYAERGNTLVRGIW